MEGNNLLSLSLGSARLPDATFLAPTWKVVAVSVKRRGPPCPSEQTELLWAWVFQRLKQTRGGELEPACPELK